METYVYSLILAAGASRRFHGCKQLARFDGQSLIARAIKQAEALTAGRVHLVLGARAEEIKNHCADELAQYSPNIVYCADWQEGMGRSLSEGISALPRDAAAVVILLSDQVRVGQDQLQKLIDTWQRLAPGAQQTTIVCAEYEGIVGVPALFPAHYFDELRRLSGDRGAKKILTSYAKELVKVGMAEAAIDIDTQEQLNSLGDSDDKLDH